MAKTLLSIGVSSVLDQGVSYALPTKLCYITSTHPLETSMDESTWIALPNANSSGSFTGAMFVRCPSANATVICKEGTVAVPSGASNAIVASYLALGTNPAQSNEIRLPNISKITVRNAANTADMDIVQSTTTVLQFGNTTGIITRVYTGSCVLEFNPSKWIHPGTDADIDLGHSTKRFRNVRASGAVITGVKAGAPVDADVDTPTDGMIRLDSTNNKIMVRIGGVWKGVVVA